MLADMCRVTDADVARGRRRCTPRTRRRVRRRSRSTGSSPTSTARSTAAINTALRLADHLARDARRREPLRVLGRAERGRSSARRSRPRSPRSPTRRSRSTTRRARRIEPVPAADVGDRDAVGHGVLRRAVHGAARRKFYLIQDFEPMFYPAGTLYALAEESYRLGLYGLCNTEHMRELYEQRYGGQGMSFQPAVDPTVFHAEGRHVRAHARPGRHRLRVRAARATGGTAGSSRRSRSKS